MRVLELPCISSISPQYLPYISHLLLRMLELLGREGLLEEGEEHGERVAVHRVDAAQVEQREEEARAHLGDGAVHLALLVEAVLQGRGLLELLLDRGALRLELVERDEQRLILEDVAWSG